MIKEIKEVHISEIKSGDTIIHHDVLSTVSNSNINYCSFNGITIFGDSYMLGRRKVKLAII